jgi:hypothetical protein
METSELDTVVVVYFDACLDASCNRVLALPDRSVHQLYDFLSRDSGGTSVRLDEAPSSV